jgi:hypothetical protein
MASRSDSRAREVCKRAESTFEKQSARQSLNQELAEIFFPERASFFGADLIGDEYYRDKYDGSPMFMRWRLGNALGAMSRGRGQEWFEAKVFPDWLNEKDPVADWNADKTKTMRSLVYDERAQMGAQLSLSDQDYATFGYSCVKLTTNDDLSGLLFRTKHLASVAGEENGEGIIDVTHERLRPTGRVALKMFERRGNLPRALKQAAMDDPSGRLDGLMLSVFPLGEYEPSKKRPPSKDHKWVALYVDCDTESVVQEEFFWSFPYIWRRWLQAVANSPYAVSPCAMLALADSHMGQDIRRTMIEAMERAADPPQMIAAGAIDGSLDLAPSGENYIRRNFDWRSGKPIQAVENGAMPNFAFEFAKSNTEAIAQYWLINLLTLPQDREMTAYETERLIDQDAREASPIFEPMEGDNARMMNRADDIGTRWGAFAPRPEQLVKRGVESKYSFETPISIALRRLRAQQATQVISFVGQMAQLEAQYQQTQAFRSVDWHKVIRDAIRGIGPGDWVRDEQEAAGDIAGDQQEVNIQKAIQLASQTNALASPSALSAGKPRAALPAPAPVNAQPV